MVVQIEKAGARLVLQEQVHGICPEAARYVALQHLRRRLIPLRHLPHAGKHPVKFPALPWTIKSFHGVKVWHF